jgi:hypothetical protein
MATTTRSKTIAALQQRVKELLGYIEEAYNTFMAIQDEASSAAQHIGNEEYSDAEDNANRIRDYAKEGEDILDPVLLGLK